MAAKLKLSPVKRIRGINQATQLLIFVLAGGRCEFDGCNKYLLEHPLTLKQGNFGQMAHIVAFSEGGPRGKTGGRPVDINDVSNLMLLCPQCHKLIDTHPDRYSRSTLEKYKSRHEDRIKHVTGLGPDLKTTILQLKANIGNQAVDIPVAQVVEAVTPRFPTDMKGFVIDLTAIHGEKKPFIKTACDEIERKIRELLAPGMDVEKTRHISLFALAPMPLLIFLGKQLSNKIPVDLFQRHRDCEDWTWKNIGDPVSYKFKNLRRGKDLSKVALILSLSGKIHVKKLPKEIDEFFYIYEITLDSQLPSPIFLKTRDNLIVFKDFYQSSLRKIMRDHGSVIKTIQLFPAVPAPVAVLVGRELLPKVDPGLRVYDFDKSKGGFNFILEVK